MKFFEFNDYEYYALIVANNEEKAMFGYEETVADIYKEEKELEPNVITLEEALERYKKENLLLTYKNGDIEGTEDEDEKTKDFYKCLEDFNGEYMVLLIDGSLI